MVGSVGANRAWWRGWWVALYAVILLAAFALRLWNLGTQSLWHDEGWAVFPAYTPFAPMGIRGADVNAPAFFYATIGGWLRIVGDSVWAMRYWSLLIGVIGVAVGMWLARRWFGLMAGAVTGILLGFSPILWVFSQEIRAYIPMPLYAVLLLALAEMWLMPSRANLPRRALLWLPMVELLALYSQNLSVPLVAWLNFAVVIGLAWRRAWRRLIVWFAIQTMLLILYLPWLLTQRQTGTPLNTPPSLTLDLVGHIWQSYFTGIKALVNADSLLIALTLIFAVVTLICSLRLLLTARTMRLWLLFSAAFGLPIFQLAIIFAANIDFHPRYFILGVPGTMLLVTGGINRFQSTARPQAGFSATLPIKFLITPSLRGAPTGANIAVATLAVAMMARMAWLTYSSPIYQHDDFRALAERYAQLSEDAAIIVPYQWEPSLDYYAQKMNFRASFIEVPLHSSPETIITMLRQGLRGKSTAEVITWFQLPADVRGAYPCLLSAIGRLEDTITVSGLKSERYAIDPNLLDSLDVGNIRPIDGVDRFGVRLTGLLPLRSGMPQQVCVALRWEHAAGIASGLRLSTRFISIEEESIFQQGQVLTASDTDFLSDKQLPSGKWREAGVVWTFTQPKLPFDGAIDSTVIATQLYTQQGQSATGDLGGLLIQDIRGHLATHSFESLPAHYSEPVLPIRLSDAPHFSKVGTLLTADAPETVLSNTPFEVTLVWQAQSPPIRQNLTVFVHLVGTDRAEQPVVVAQSDSAPMNGGRPTTSWRENEPIMDRHTLTFHVKDYQGAAKLRIGLYDPISGARVALSDGSDALELPITVQVK